jgi:oligoribonuclease
MYYLAGEHPMLVWIDLEMTGLEVDKDKILEIAALITSETLEIIAEAEPIVLSCSERDLELMAPIVREMHTKSGLLEQVKSSSLSVEQAEHDTLAFIRRYVPEPGSSPLCGNSIGYDRRFVAKYMPTIDKYLHYRCIDVSTITCLASVWAPEVFNAEPPRDNRHRALDDIRESVQQLRYYRQYMFQSARPS